MDGRKISCFVIKFGKFGEMIVKDLWENYQKFFFVSLVNLLGKGNCGMVEFIGECIELCVDLIICVNEYVKFIQFDEIQESCYE